MRKILFVALLLYNYVARATRPSPYDYDDVDGSKRHSLIEDRRNWRKKTLMKQPLDDHKDYDRWRYEYENQRYLDEQDQKAYNTPERPRDRDRGDRGDRGDRDLDMQGPYRGGSGRGNHYELDNNVPQNTKNVERDAHPPPYIEKESEPKSDMNCDRPHERYEVCFAGCASVTCDNPRDRLRPCYPFCEPGCICVRPYVRDDRTHKCVLPEDCTKGLKGIPDLNEDT